VDEVDSRNGELALVGPGAAQLAGCAGEELARLGVDEQLWHGRGAKPGCVGLDDSGDIGGLAGEGQLAWPDQHLAARFAGLAPWAAVDVELLRGELAQHAAGKEPFDEHIFLEDELFTFGAADAFDELAAV